MMVMDEGSEQEGTNSATELRDEAVQPQTERPAGESSGRPAEASPASSRATVETPPAAVKIRGRPGGVSIEMEEEGDWDDLLKALDERLSAAEGFFRGGRAALELGLRGGKDDLRQVRTTLVRHGAGLSVVRPDGAANVASGAGAGTVDQQRRGACAFAMRRWPRLWRSRGAIALFLHNGTLRSGQVLRKAESMLCWATSTPVRR